MNSALRSWPRAIGPSICITAPHRRAELVRPLQRRGRINSALRSRFVPKRQSSAEPIHELREIFNRPYRAKKDRPETDDVLLRALERSCCSEFYNPSASTLTSNAEPGPGRGCVKPVMNPPQ